jgi:hypothetical protein
MVRVSTQSVFRGRREPPIAAAATRSIHESSSWLAFESPSGRSGRVPVLRLQQD